jgi:hypothetical protein
MNGCERMHIGVDALAAGVEWGGLTTYVRQIIGHLTRIDKENWLFDTFR